MTGAKRKRSAVWRKIQAVRFEDIKVWCMRRLPIFKWVPVYNWKENLIPDTVSGTMLAIQQVTQGTVNSFQIHILKSGHAELVWPSFSFSFFSFLFNIIVKLWLKQRHAYISNVDLI